MIITKNLHSSMKMRQHFIHKLHRKGPLLCTLTGTESGYLHTRLNFLYPVNSTTNIKLKSILTIEQSWDNLGEGNHDESTGCPKILNEMICYCVQYFLEHGVRHF